MTQPNFIIGIGASAGGLDALESFFQRIPRHTGAAFVVVQHLSPDFNSVMDEILARDTEIPILQAEHGIRLQPDYIYLATPRQDMILSNGELVLSDHDPSAGIHLPIDVFFSSLASDAGKRAVGVILSGTGSDGSRGIQRIHQAGGYVVAQEPSSAKFDGMPEAAISTGAVDLTSPAHLIASAIVAHMEGRDYDTSFDLRVQTGDLDNPSSIERVFGLIHGRFGVDFRKYRPSTVERRLERRISVTRCSGIDQYVEYLAQNPTEVDNLYHDLLIGVTEFFRDPDAFSYLAKNVIPELFNELPEGGGTLRVWTPGCASGAEAYSLAMLIYEHRERMKPSAQVKIFATDVHESSLERASSGIFDESIEKHVSPERLARFFDKLGSTYKVKNDLRQLLVFAPQNVITDAPFTNLHLIVCRNLLIYFEPPIQRKVLSLFHFGLKKNGALFLGHSESLGPLQDSFETLSGEWKIFRKTHAERLVGTEGIPLGLPARSRRAGGRAFGRLESNPNDLLAWAYESLLTTVVESGVLVDSKKNVVHVFGNIDDLVAPLRGRPSLLINAMLKPEIASFISAAMHRADKEGQTVEYRNVRVSRSEDTDISLTLKVTPLLHGRSGMRYHFVSFVDIDKRESPAVVFDGQASSPSRVADLESELQYTKEHLQAANEELATSNEELQATNEELLAANEELQSTNEELQSTNEELQSANEELHSVNEELHTVNAEYNLKIRELRDVTSDLENLLHSTDLGVIFLDRELRIRRFTPATTSAVALSPRDLGRPFSQIVHGLGADDQVLVRLAGAVLDGRSPEERELRSSRDQWFTVHALPYMTGKGEIEGVVLTFRDITDKKRIAMERDRYTEKLEASNQDLQDFAYVASHDLQAPVRAVVGFADLISAESNGHTPGKQREWLENVRRAGAEMQALIDGLLSFSRVHSRGSPASEHDCNKLLDSALESCASRIKDRGVIVNRSLLPTLNVDGKQLQQLLLNLIDNAITFNESDIPQVDISAVHKGGEWVFTIRDNGIGIPQNYHDEIFVIFRRLNPKSEYDGIGIGLAMCKRIVQRHGGRMWVESEPGVGTAMHFALPIEGSRQEETGGSEVASRRDTKNVAP
ncbi:MAG: chemotaxis protein CheB [Myxococcota bacterium]